MIGVGALAGSCSLPRDPEGSFDRIRRTGIVRAGLTEHPPFTTIDGGPEAQLIEAFARAHGARVEWHRNAESALFEALERYDLDIVVGGITPDTPWAPRLALTRPYLERHGTRYVVAVAPGENRLLVELERIIRDEAPRVAAAVGGTPRS